MSDTLSIHEFSKLSGIESSTLRYWDDNGVFAPLKRNPENNYRHYSISQLIALNFVTTLCALGIPLKTITELRENRDPELLLDLLDKKERELDIEMNKLQVRYSIIHTRRELIKLGLRASVNDLSVVYLEEKPLMLWHRNNYNEGDSFLESLAAQILTIGKRRINLSFPIGGLHDNIYAFIKDPSRPNRFISIDPLGTYTRKAGDYLVGYSRGNYGQLGSLPEKMHDFARKNSLELTGPVYTLLLHENTCVKDPADFLTQCSIAVKKSRAAHTK